MKSAIELTAILDGAFAQFSLPSKIAFWDLRQNVKAALAEGEIAIAEALIRRDVRSDDFPDIKAALLAEFAS